MSWRNDPRDRAYGQPRSDLTRARGSPYARYEDDRGYRRPSYRDDQGGYGSRTEHRSYRTDTPSKSNYAEASTDRNRGYRGSNHRFEGKGQTARPAVAGATAREQPEGIKGRDLGYALIGQEKHQYLTTRLRGQLEHGANSTTAAVREDGTDTPSRTTTLTPRQIVDECQRSGHFDALRKQTWQEFQSSSAKGPFLQRFEQYLLARIEALPPLPRQRLANQDRRLQHSELTRWTEEGKEAAALFDGLFAQLRGDVEAQQPQQSTEDASTATDPGLLHAHGDRLLLEIQGRLQDVIAAERRRAHNAAHEGDSDEEGESATNSGGTPAAIKSSATPQGQETPREGSRAASTGYRTPLPS